MKKNKLIAIAALLFHVMTFSVPQGLAADGWVVMDNDGNVISQNDGNTTNVNVVDGSSYTVANGDIALDQIINVNVLNSLGIADAGAKAVFNFNDGQASVWEGVLNLVGTAAFINAMGFDVAASFEGNVSGGAILSSLGINEAQFFAGIAELARGINDPAAVINNGTWNVDPQSFLALVGSAVQNLGTINANGGAAVLAAGDKVTLDISGGNGLISVSVDQAINAPVYDRNGNKISDVISNSGVIRANGGLAVLSAKAAESLFDNIVNHSGIIEANSLSSVNGRIILDGGDQGVTNVTGVLNAQGDNLGETGGTVHVLGKKVGLFSNALINVSGFAGGGTALIGGDYQGLGSVRNADATYIGQGVTIKADALDEGDGGKVIVWADNTTRAYGTISAKGGSISGDGGLVETSGKEFLDVDGLAVDASASNGNGGTWLLDPRNVDVVDDLTNPSDKQHGGFGAASGVGGAGAGDWYPDGSASTSETSQVLNTQINSHLNAGTNVTISSFASGGDANHSTGNIRILAPISKIAGTDARLFLNTDVYSSNAQAVTIGAAITSTAGKLDLKISAGGSGGVAGLVSFLAAAVVSLNGGYLEINGASNVTQAAGSTIKAGLVDVTSKGGISLNQAGNEFSSLYIDSINNGNIDIADSGTPTSIIQMMTNGGSINYAHTGSGDVTVGAGSTVRTNNGATAGGNITMNTSHGLSFDAASVVKTSDTGGGTVNVTGATVLTTPIAGAGTTITLNGGAPDTVIDFTISGPISQATNYIISATRDILGQATVTTTGGASVSMTADSDLDGLGGVWIESAGGINSSGDVTLVGSAINKAGAGNGLSVFIENDGANRQIQATGDVNLLSSSAVVPAGKGGINVQGIVETTGLGKTINIDSKGAVVTNNSGPMLIGDNVTIKSVGGTNVKVDADNLSYNNSGGGTVAIEDFAGGLTITGASNVGGLALSIVTHSPLTIAADIIQAAAISLTAGEAAGAGDDLTVNSGITVQSTGSSVDLSAGDNIVLSATSNVQAASTVTLTAASGDTDNAGTMSLAGGVNAGTDLNLNSTKGAITQTTGSLVAPGTATITATGQNVTLNSANNNFAIVAANGADVAITDVSGVNLGASTVTGTLGVTANGAITDSGNLSVTGTTTLAAGAANDITLNNDNNFSTVIVTTGKDVTLKDTGAINLGNLAVSGLLNVNAGGLIDFIGNAATTVATTMGLTTTAGGITDSATGSVTVTGATTLNATGAGNNITLDNVSNNFGTVAITNGSNVSLRDTNALDLGASNIGGTLGVVTNGAITDSGAIIVNGGTTLTAGAANDITLNNANDFQGPVSIVSGKDVSINASVLDLGTSTVTGILDVATVGALSDSGTVTAASLKFAAGTTATLDSANNDFDTIAGTSNGAIKINDIDSFSVGTVNGTDGIVSTNNNIEIISGANITLDKAVNAGTGDATLTAAGFIREGAVSDDGAPIADVIGKNIFLNSQVAAPGDALGLSTGYLDLQVTNTATGSWNVGVPNSGNVYINCIGDCPIGQVNVGTATFNFSTSGALLDGNDDVNGEFNGGTWNVTAGGLNVRTGTGFGTITDAIELRLAGFAGVLTDAGRMAVDGGTGGVYAVNLNTLNAAGLAIGGVAGSFVAGIQAAGGGIGIGSGSPLAVNAAVNETGGGDIYLAALGAAAADDLTVNANISATGGNGDVALLAGDSVILNAGTVTSVVGTGVLGVYAGEDATDFTVDQDGNVNGNITMDATASLVSAGGTITLDAAKDIATGIINAGAGIVSFFARTGAVSDTNAAANNVTANSVTATAATGIDLDTTITTLTNANVTGTGAIDINDLAGGLAVTSATTTDGQITINATGGNLDATTVTAAGTSRNVTLSTTTSGNVNVGNVTAAGDNIAITSVGNIEELGADGAADLTSATMNLTSATGVGNAAQIEIDATTLTNASVSGIGAINLTDLAGGLVVTSATTADGAITLNATSGNLTLNSVIAGGAGRNVNVSTTASGNIIVGLVSALDDIANFNSAGTILEAVNDDLGVIASDINAGTIDLTTAGGDIGQFASYLDITPTTLWNATSNGGDIYVSCIGACPMGQIDAGTGTFYYAGNITDGNDIVNGEVAGGVWNIRAGGFHADSDNSVSGFIGAASNWVEAQLANYDGVVGALGRFVATAGTGGIHLSNDGGAGHPGLQVGGVTPSTVTGLTSTGGIEVYSFSPLTIAANVTDNSVNSIDLVAVGNAAADDLTIQTGVTVQQLGAGNINLFAGDDVTLQGTALVQSTTGVVNAVAGENRSLDLIGDALESDGTNAASIVMNSNSAFRSQDATINLTANNHLRISEVNANSNNDGTLGNVNLNADFNANGVGRIEDRNGAAALNVTGNALVMRAGSGIGVDSTNAIDAIETSVNTVDLINSTSGHVAVTEVVAGGNLDILRANQNAPVDTMTIKTLDGNLTVVGALGGGVGVTTKAGELLLEANGAGANDDLIVNHTVTSTTGKINLDSTSRDVLFDANGDVTATVGAEIEVNAFRDIFMANGTVLNANAGGVQGGIDLDAGRDITLGSVQTTSALSVNRNADGFNAVQIDAATGAVIDGGDADDDIIAQNGQTTINAVTGIGHGNQLDTQMHSLKAVNTTSNDIRIREVIAGGNLDLIGVTQSAAAGDLNIRTLDGSLTVLAVGLGGLGVSAIDGVTRLFARDNNNSGADHLVINHTVRSADGKINLDSENDVIASAAGDVTAGDATLKLGATGAEIEVDAIDNITMADGTIFNANAGGPNGGIDMDAQNGNITLGSVQTSNASNNAVTIFTRDGAIIDGGDIDRDIVNTGGGGVILSAQTGIGSRGTGLNLVPNPLTDNFAPDAIDMTGAGTRLSAFTESGDIQIQNIGALEITTLADNNGGTPLGSAGAGTVTGVQINDPLLADPNSIIFITAASPITVNSVVRNFDGGNVSVYALGGTPADTMTINADIQSIGGNGDVRVVSGGSMTMAPNVSISTQGNGAVAGTGRVAVGAGYNATSKAANEAFAPGVSLLNPSASLFDTVGDATANLTMDELSRIWTEDGNILVDVQNVFTVGRVDADGNNDANGATSSGLTDGNRGDITTFSRNGSTLDAEPSDVGNLDFLANVLTMFSGDNIGLSTNHIEIDAPIFNAFAINNIFVDALGSVLANMFSENGSIQFTATGDILLGTAHAGNGGVSLTAGGSILSQGGSDTRVIARTPIQLTAGGVIGTLANAINTQLNGAGTLLINAGSAINGLSANVTGNFPTLGIQVLNAPGLVLFNGLAVGGDSLNGLQTSLSSLFQGVLPQILGQFGRLNGNVSQDFPGLSKLSEFGRTAEAPMDTTGVDRIGLPGLPTTVQIPGTAAPTEQPRRRPEAPVVVPQPPAVQTTTLVPATPATAGTDVTPPTVVPIPDDAAPTEQELNVEKTN